MIEIAVLGKLQIRWEGEEITAVLPQKGQALLAYLAVSGQPITRSALAGLLWGGMPEEVARANLRLTLSRLRKVVGESIMATRTTIAFDADQPHWLDLALFLQQPDPRPPSHLQELASLYRGDFLDDLLVSDAPGFENWVLTLREQLRQQFFRLLSQLVAEAEQQQQWAAGIAWARRLLALEPWHEAMHRQLMRLLVANGQRSAAIAQFRICADLLAEELGVEPEPETVALDEWIRLGSGGADVQIDRNAEENRSLLLPPPSVHRHTLPGVATRLVGREVELAQLQQLLGQPDCRLLTLVGMGGNGKTRLAVAVADTQIGIFADGVVFVSLVGKTAVSAAEANDLLATAIAEALGYTFSAQRPPQELLLDYLGDKKLLLLLDNFEELLVAAPLLLTLLAATPGLKLLVTSRERLHVTAEWVFDVTGLPFPTTNGRSGATDWAKYPALVLFAERAAQVQPDFVLAQAQTAVERICQLVHGSPLAIELAANWVRLLSCDDIANRLAQNLDLLQGNVADRRLNQQSIATVLDASWELLAEDERQAMRRLAVFHGGWRLLAAQQVAGVDLPLLARLVDRSLLEVVKNGRYRLHELVRQYGLARLNQSAAEAAAMQAQHCRFYAAFLQERQPRLADKVAVLELDDEVENLRAVWQWVLGQGERPFLAPFLAGLWLYYRRKGWYQEAVGVLKQACQLPDLPALQQAQWRRWLGEAYYQLGDMEESQKQVELGLVLLKRPLPAASGGWLWLAGRQSVRQLSRRLLPSRSSSPPAITLTPLREATQALRLLAQLHYFAKQREKGAVLNTYALNLAEKEAMPAETALGYAGMTVLFRNLARHRLANRYRRLAEGLLPAIHMAEEKAAVLQLIGYDSMSMGQWLIARQTLTEAAALFIGLEMGRNWEECWTLLGFLHRLRGDFDQGAKRYAEGCVSAGQRGDPFFRFVGLMGQATCLLPLGAAHLPDVVALLEQAQAIPKLVLAAEDKVLLYGVLGRVQLRLGNYAEAEVWARETLTAIAQSSFMFFYSLDGYVAPAEIFLALTREAADSGTVGSLSREQEGRQALRALERFARVYPVGQPLARLAAGGWAWENGRFPQAHQLWQQSLADAQKLAMPYETAVAHREIGHHIPEEASERGAHLHQAERILASLGIAPL